MSSRESRAVVRGSARRRRSSKSRDPPYMSDLRIVLLGKSVSENSEVGNFILGRAAFDSEAPPDVVERVGGRLKDRHVMVINSPQLLQTHLSLRHITQIVSECVYLSDPGPHVIVLLLKHDQCSAEDQECVEKVLDSFSERVYQHSMVLTTQEPTETNDILQKIIQKCCNRHFSLQGRRSPDDLLQIFEDIVKMNDGRHLVCAEASQYYSMRQQANRLSEGEKLNLVVCGSDGTLKSSISELILQQKDRRSDVKLHGRVVSVVELPALFNTRLSEEEVMRQTLRCVSLSDPGVHVFLLIVPDAPLTDEDKAEMEEIQRIFSSRINKHIMILIMQNSEHQTAELNEETQSVIERFGGRHHFFGPNTQVSTLMENIEQMLEENRGEVFSTETFLEAQMTKLMKYEEMKKKIHLQETPLQSQESKRNQSPPGKRPNMSDLRIVLLGKNTSENNRVGNFILDKQVFGKESSPDVETFIRTVERRNITVISTTQLLKSNLSLSRIAEKVSALSCPEPHVIILVLQHDDFSEKDRDRVPSVLNFFEQAMKRTMILTTDDETREENEFIQEISRECGGFRLQLQNKQRSQLLQKVDEIITLSEFKETQQSSSVDQELSRSVCSVRPKERAAGSDHQKFGKHDERQKEMKEENGSQKHDMCDLRIVLLGKNVSENSKVRNMILGTDVHEEPPLQQHCLSNGGTVKNRQVCLINPLHLLNPNTLDHQITETVRECVDQSDPGPHSFILIVQHKDFTENDMRRVKYVLSKFSEEAIKRTIVLTTDEEAHGSHMLSLTEINTTVHQLIKECGGGHLQLYERKPECQSEIFNRVDKILKENHDAYLKYEIFEDVIETQDEEQSRSDDSVRSEEESKEHSYHKDDGNPKQSKRSEENLIDIREWIRSDLSSNPSKKQKLNLVVCGSDGSKIKVSKLLRGVKIKLNLREISEECVIKEEKIYDRAISVVEFPALSRLSEQEVMRQTLRCVSLCDPGVHVFLIIVPVGPLHDDDKAEMEKILKNFYSIEHLIVIFINDGTVDRPVTDYVKYNTESRRLIGRCGGQYSVMSLKQPENSRQIPDLLDYIENMKTEPYSLQTYVKAQEKRVRHETKEKYKKELKRMEDEIKALKQKIQPECAEGESDDQKCLRIVLIGKTGSGKSATGNTILGRTEFQSQLNTDSVTTVCEKGVGEDDGRSVAVVDTPGLFDTTLTNDQVVEEIMKCVSLSSPGPHVFVIVLSVGRFTKEEADTVDLIKKIFGHKAAQFSIVLFTRGDDLEDESVEDYVKRSKSAELKKLIRECGNRLLVFNNREKQDRTQVTRLLNMIEEVKNTNEGRYFTNSMFEEAEMSIKKRMEEIMKEREREIQAQHEELKAKYESEMENMMKRLEEEKQRADEEKMKMQNQLREKEENLRKEFDEKEKAEQKRRETEKQKQSEEEKQQRAEYHQKIEEMKKENENQRSQYEKQQKRREEEDRKREEKYRQDQDRMKNEQQRIIAELQIKQEEEIKKRESEKQRRKKEEEEERQEWERKNKEAENGRKEIQEEIKRQQREWEDEKKQQTREREEEERKRKEKHEKQLREKQEELEKMRERFEREREEERQKIEEERQKQRREREEKEREYKDKKIEMERHYERLERERKEEWERRKREDDERREEERKRWKKTVKDLKREQEEEIKRRETEEKVRKEREEKERNEMKQKHKEEIKDMKKKQEDEARKKAEEFNEFRDRKEQHIQELKQMLDEHQKQRELLEELFQHFKDEKSDEVKHLKEKIEDLNNKQCILL